MMLYGLAILPLMWIARTDAVIRSIPPVPLYLLIALGVLRAIFMGWSCLISSAVGFLIIGIPMLFLSCYLDGGNSIGGGDVKLSAVLGFLLGPMNALFVLMAALLMLTIYAMLTEDKSGQPFAPFVLLGYDLEFIILLISGG